MIRKLHMMNLINIQDKQNKKNFLTFICLKKYTSTNAGYLKIKNSMFPDFGQSDLNFFGYMLKINQFQVEVPRKIFRKIFFLGWDEKKFLVSECMSELDSEFEDRRGN